MNKNEVCTYLCNEVGKAMACNKSELIYIKYVKNKKVLSNKSIIIYCLENYLKENNDILNYIIDSKCNKICCIKELTEIKKYKWQKVLCIEDNADIYINIDYFSKSLIKYIGYKEAIICIIIFLCDVIIVGRVKNINYSLSVIDFALDMGKDILAVPGDIRLYNTYLANYCIKQGAIPICNKKDMLYYISEKTM